jgi:ATP-dependent RNA helicase DeaD
VAISLVSGMEEIELEQIAKKFSIPMVEHSVPADEELETLISQRAVFLLEARLRKADNIQKERMQRFMRTVGELATNDDSRALLAMLVDEFYQSTFHAPLEQPSEKLIEMVRPARPESRPAAKAGAAVRGWTGAAARRWPGRGREAPPQAFSQKAGKRSGVRRPGTGPDGALHGSFRGACNSFRARSFDAGDCCAARSCPA